MTVSPFSHEPRRRLTAQQVAQVFAACGGRCQGPCGRTLRPGDDYDIDHTVALCNGGTNDLSNLRVLCVLCHGSKTAADKAALGHSRRTYSKHVVPKRHRDGGRGFHRPAGTRFDWSKGRYVR